MHQQSAAKGGTRLAQKVQWNNVTQTGAYVTEEGSLVCFEPNGLKGKNSPAVTVRSRLNTELTKISDDPFISTDGARRIALDLGLPVNF